jgi:hypothetical protein
MICESVSAMFVAVGAVVGSAEARPCDVIIGSKKVDRKLLRYTEEARVGSHARFALERHTAADGTLSLVDGLPDRSRVRQRHPLHGIETRLVCCDSGWHADGLHTRCASS